jgi:hypothetical protein
MPVPPLRPNRRCFIRSDEVGLWRPTRESCAFVSLGNVTTCAFCPNTSNITGEHIWSSWIGRILPTKRYIYRRDEGEEETQWSSTKIDQKTNVVCKTCNETWMSDLEGKAKDFLTPLIRDGKPSILTPEDQSLLAAYAFKHAAISNHAAPPSDAVS